MAYGARYLPLLSLFLASSCSTVSDDLSRQLLQPKATLLAEPADFGLAAERFEVVLHSEASITGWVIPNDAAQGRTVVLFHDADTNASAVHPYWRMLHAAGLQVVVFDPRGYGRSRGTATLQAWIWDLPRLFRWLRERRDVDHERTAFFGTGMGACAAMFAARTQGCRALVVEDLTSPRDLLRAAQGDDGSALAAVQLGFTEFAGLPDEIEPEDNAPRVQAPALFLLGDQLAPRTRTAAVRTFGRYAGPKQLWVLAGTGRAPHGMLTHDQEYQHRIGAFLHAALHDAPAVPTVEVAKVDEARDGQGFWQVVADGCWPGTSLPEQPPQAVEVAAVLADGSVQYGQTLQEGRRARVRLKLPSAPVAVGAVAVPFSVGDAEARFRREASALTRSGAAVDPLWSRIEALRNDTLPPAEQRRLAADLAAAEAAEPFHALLAAELADVHARLGRTLLAGDDPAQRDEGRRLLQRAVADAPAQPHLHFWPGPTATWGFPWQDEIDAARRLLAAPPR